MNKSLKTLAALALGTLAAPAFALNILLTNDDGYTSTGITEMRTALVNAGHTVTLVAPLSEQSGKGGSLNTGFNTDVAVVEQSPGIWSVDSSPSDCIRAAFGMANTPEGGVVTRAGIDLVVSGINEGSNLAMTGTQGSGTINAALAALHHGVPAIAVSAEYFGDVGATDAAYPAIADYIVRMVDRLDTYRYGGEMIPPGTILNVNWPVTLEEGRTAPRGPRAKIANLATQSTIELQWKGDPTTGLMTVWIDFDQINPPADPDPVTNNDTDFLRDDYVTLSVLDGDMTARNKSKFPTDLMTWILHGLPICDTECTAAP